MRKQECGRNDEHPLELLLGFSTFMSASLLLLIPAYNEEHRIEPVLRDYAQYKSITRENSN